MSRPPEVLIYATDWCGYCAAARALLAERQVRFAEINVDHTPGARDEMINRSGRRTVPQIFFGDRHIGGYDDLAALERNGELDRLLQAPP